MQLVEQGKLELDEPVGEILPELAHRRCWKGSTRRARQGSAPRSGPITLRQLLTHTAGFTYDIWNANTGRYEKYAKLPGHHHLQERGAQDAAGVRPGRSLGVRHQHRLGGQDGRSGERPAARKLFPRAHLRPARHGRHQLHAQPVAARAAGRQCTRAGADGSLNPIDFEMPQEPEFSMGGGGLYSTGPDYLKFVRMFLQPRQPQRRAVLQPETVAVMAQNQIGDINVVVLKTAIPASSNDAEFFPGMVKKWGLGFMINTEAAPTGRSAGSLAWAGLANTYFWIDPSGTSPASS